MPSGDISPHASSFALAGKSTRCIFFCPVQEQQKESAKLRARVTQAAIERGTLVAEVRACDSSLSALSVRVPCVLCLCVLPRLEIVRSVHWVASCGGVVDVAFRGNYRLFAHRQRSTQNETKRQPLISEAKWRTALCGGYIAHPLNRLGSEKGANTKQQVFGQLSTESFKRHPFRP